MLLVVKKKEKANDALILCLSPTEGLRHFFILIFKTVLKKG